MVITNKPTDLKLVAFPGGTAVVDVWHNGELIATITGCMDRPGVIISTPNGLHVEVFRPDIPSESRALVVTVEPRGR